jgi:4-hydroxy-3-methylbut-2-enyl diphosphate reductase
MVVIRAKVLGFCMGVRRAVDLAEAELQRGGPVYSLGPLIHNPQVLASLEAKGLKIINEFNHQVHERHEQKFNQEQCSCGLCGSWLKNSSIIIRAHGVAPEVEESLRAGGANIVDATCPRVKASQKIVRTLAESGFAVFIAGEKNHAEVAGLLGYCPGAAVIGTVAEAEAAAQLVRAAQPDAKTALVAQTTFSAEEYGAIAAALAKVFPDIEIKATICDATSERQKALRELSGTVDALVVAGGKGSANTRRLLAIAEECGKPAFLAESAADLAEADFSGCKKIGLCAGASTPDETIDEIEKMLLSI